MKMEKEIKNDQELYSYYRTRISALTRDNFSFLYEHKEIKQLLNDYLANILLHKPDDVFKFTKDYFKFLSSTGQSDPFTVLVGPSSVGKTDLLNKLLEEYPDYFEIPKFICTMPKENCNEITEEEYLNLENKKELILNYYNEAGNYYYGLSKKEIEKIKENHKIILLETKLSEAIRINQSSVPANFIGILPPSLDDLRKRIEKHTKLNTASINKELEIAQEEIKEIENYTFFNYRIINDIFETGYKDLKNAILSLYPNMKYTPESIGKLKAMENGKFSGEDNN